ncbi:hypothetical protein IM816_05950 [Luteibacter flocculans]|uniref:Uncharacterized protein n=1 Tax=Luteibacter flocculans TaxID=2780091 RepID=A0ABY4T424_9GAMM|nr:hypothetical protein [Luteibacter flocculans]URL59639.1 hypothetical protein IM816_05950 [Luteibacter flocculans]
MAFYGRNRSRSEADARRERENAWVICPHHGGYNPWQRTLGGWRQRECPKCAVARYEATQRRD